MKKWLTIVLVSLSFYQHGKAQWINSIEYFFDKDLNGVGTGTSLPAFIFGDTIRLTTNASVSQLSNGMHTMYIRARSDDGWSQYAGAFFFVRKDVIEDEPKIDSAEYFFDHDPGVGNALPLTVGGLKDTVILTTIVPLNSLPTGFHAMCIRVKNANGKYSHFATQLLYVSNDINDMPAIVSGEYFLDHDPGIGLGLPMTKFNFSPSGNTVMQTFNLSLPPGTDTGIHYMYVRVKDVNGHWSLFQDTIRGFTLPVTGLTLSAEKKSNRSLLKWFTLSESNSNHFEVEKSLNGLSFSRLGNVNAKGYSNNKSNYTFTDEEPATGLNYYRIKEVDNDGKFMYSSIVKLWFDEQHGLLSIFPNPSTEVVNVKYKSSRTSIAINAYDGSGKWVKLWRLPVNNDLQLNVSELPSGTYTIHISDGVDSQTGKFVKK